MPKCGILLVGHGSRFGCHNDLVVVTAAMMMDKRPDAIIKPCFLAYDRPNVSEALDCMRYESISVLIVLPLFLADGVHTMRDIPNLLGLDEGVWCRSFILDTGESVPLVYAKPIGIDPLLTELMLKNADAALVAVNKVWSSVS